MQRAAFTAVSMTIFGVSLSVKASTLSESLKKEIKRADQVAAYFEATELAGFSTAEAAQYFGRPRWISPEKLDLEPKRAKVLEKASHNRFAAINEARS